VTNRFLFIALRESPYIYFPHQADPYFLIVITKALILSILLLYNRWTCDQREQGGPFLPLLLYTSHLLCPQAKEDDAVAEDIAAEAFVKLWQPRSELREPQAVKAWLYSTVRHAALDYLRHQKRKVRHHKEVIYLQPLAEERILHRRIQTEVHHELYESLAALPPKCGRMLRMAIIQGKSNGEIAKELNVSINTVKNRY
jgi:RNA polymerase sigma factor (sigma-70 family)